MKKFISLALSIMMVMSLVTVPVMAEDAVVDETPEAPIVVTPATASVEPSVWVAAANVEDYMLEEYGGYYCTSGWVKDENDNYFVVGGVKYDRFKWYNNNYSSGNNGFGAFDKMAPKKPVYLTMISGSVYDADKDGAASVTPWDGFRIKADVASGVGSAYTSTGTIAFSNYNKTMYADKDLRVDSIRFKMDAYDSDSWVTLLGLNNSNWRSNDPAYNSANSPTAIRIINGGVKYNDVNAGGYVDLLPAESLKADTWYRIEKIADVRVVNDTTEEVWQRAIIYVDATNEIVAETGWVKAAEQAQATNHTHPFHTAGSGAGKFPEGAHVYFDDFKSWAVEDAAAFMAGVADNYPKYLTYPIANDGTGRNSAEPAKTYRYNWGLGFSTHMNYYWPNTYGSADFDGDGVKEVGYYGNHSAEVKQFSNMVKNGKYIYMEQDIMIPEANTATMGFFDISTSTNYNSAHKDTSATAAEFGGNTVYNGISGIVRVTPGGILKVGKIYDKVNKGYEAWAKTEDASEEFSLTLDTNKWYNISVCIDQSEYAGRIGAFTYISGDPNQTNNKNGLIQEDGTLRQFTDDDAKVKAQVVVTDENGEVYKTEKFDWKLPSQYIYQTLYQAVILADVRHPGPSYGAVRGFKVNLDNMKVALSNGAIDDEEAFVLYEEDFENREYGASYESFIMDKFNPSSKEQLNGVKTGTTMVYSTDVAQVEIDRTAMKNLPTVAEITIDAPIKTDAASLAANVSLYQGETPVNELITGVDYDADAKTITVAFSALEPQTTYTVKFDRNIAEVEADIFSVIPAAEGYSFKTGYGDSGELIFEPVFVLSADGAEYDIEDEMVLGQYYDGDAIYGSQSTLTSLNASPVNYVAIAALYDAEGRMEDMMSQTGVITAGQTINIFTNEDNVMYASVANGDMEAKTVKAFIWNAWSLMKPIANQYVYPAE